MPPVVDESVEVWHQDIRLGRFGCQYDVIPTSYVLMYCIEIYGDVGYGTPAPPYILWRGRVTRKIYYLILQYLINHIFL